MVENMQRRSTRLLPELRHMSYKDRLKELNLPTLLYRRQRADMTQVFKIMKGIDDIAFEDFFQMADSLTRGHTLKLFKPRCNKSVRQNSFSMRIIEECFLLLKKRFKILIGV